MDTSTLAKALGRLGGQARAKNLSHEQKKTIASLGGNARAQSIAAAKRIQENFHYVDVLQNLNKKSRKVKQVKSVKERLPGIYQDEQK